MLAAGIRLYVLEFILHFPYNQSCCIIIVFKSAKFVTQSLVNSLLTAWIPSFLLEVHLWERSLSYTRRSRLTQKRMMSNWSTVVAHWQLLALGDNVAYHISRMSIVCIAGAHSICVL
jgi:hypothetical protein